MAEPICTPPDLQDTIERLITGTTRDALRYSNVHEIPEDAVPVVRNIADLAYQRGYRDGLLAEAAQHVGRTERSHLRADAAAEEDQP